MTTIKPLLHDILLLDRTTRNSLYLNVNSENNINPFQFIIQYLHTPGGRRALIQRFVNPITNRELLEKRYDVNIEIYIEHLHIP